MSRSRMLPRPARRPRLRVGRGLALLILFMGLAAAPSHADRRYFLFTYSPLLGRQGEKEVELWATSQSGKQDPAAGTYWQPRVEFEYGFTGRLRAAGYLNFEKAGGEDLKFHSPALELIYVLAEEGTLPGDPALYVETTHSREALEVESKLLFAFQRRQWMYGTNLIGEFEFRHHDDEILPGGEVMRREFAGEITSGVACQLNQHFAVGLETRYRSIHPNFHSQSAALLSAGPCVNAEFGKTQFALGVQPQLWGTPATSGNRNLDDFEKVTVRAILGFEF